MEYEMEHELREDGRHRMIASAENTAEKGEDTGGSNGGGRTRAAEKTLTPKTPMSKMPPTKPQKEGEEVGSFS